MKVKKNIPTKEAFLKDSKYQLNDDKDYADVKAEKYWEESPAPVHDLKYYQKLAEDLDKVYCQEDRSSESRDTKKRRRDRDDDDRDRSKRKKKDDKRSADRDLDPSAPEGSRTVHKKSKDKSKSKGKGKGKKSGRDTSEKHSWYV